jgi:hypothetical protein
MADYRIRVYEEDVKELRIERRQSAELLLLLAGQKPNARSVKGSSKLSYLLCSAIYVRGQGERRLMLGRIRTAGAESRGAADSNVQQKTDSPAVCVCVCRMCVYIYCVYTLPGGLDSLDGRERKRIETSQSEKLHRRAEDSNRAHAHEVSTTAKNDQV